MKKRSPSGGARRVLAVLAIGSLGATPAQCNLVSGLALGAGAGTGASEPVEIAVPAAPPPEVHREPEPPEPARPAAKFTFPDEVIVRALRVMQPTFSACWRRAQQRDPLLSSARVQLSLEVDAAGAVTAARANAEDAKLAACLSNVARGLMFPAGGREAAFDVPLFF